MATPNLLQGNPHSDRPFAWKSWRFAPGVLTAGTINITVATLPAGTIILDGALLCEVADVGATSTGWTIEVGATGAGDTALLTGGADFSGALGTTENTITEANLTTINAVSLGGSALVVNAKSVIVGTATTRPVVQLHLLLGRFAY
jgi:hypothetical protein